MAGDQVEISIPKTLVNEDSAFTATAYFFTRSTGVAATPTNINYRVDCLNTETVLKDWTSVSAATSASIPITASYNNIQSDTSKRERKQLIVQMDRGLSTQVTQKVNWLVKNLHGT